MLNNFRKAKQRTRLIGISYAFLRDEGNNFNIKGVTHLEA